MSLWTSLKRLILPGTLREDWREPRDWRRPWRDRPGFIGTAGCCCGGICLCSLDSTTTLHVTFANSGNCASLDGRTFTLTKFGTCQWSGSGTAGCTGDTIHITLQLSSALACINVGNKITISSNSGNCFLSTAMAASSCTCSPLSLVFNGNVQNNGACTCCNFNGGAPFALPTATVTL